jgi:glycosyltransferase involved in cell wall biosynthesis
MKKITVTVSLPVYNEEQNIEKIIHAIMAQKLNAYVLREVCIYSDASKDTTVAIVNRLKKTYPVIRLVQGKKQRGKYYRLNGLFASCKTDALVILDADIAIVGDIFLETLVTSLMRDPKAVMTAGHVELLRTKGFIAKMLHTNFTYWDYVRLSIPNYNTSGNFHGAVTAYRGSFARAMHIPSNLTDPHFYIYLFAKQREGFRYCRDAVILQYPPQTMKDMKKILNRTIGKHDPELERLFGKEMIGAAHYIPRKNRIRAALRLFKHYPFYAPFSFGLSLYIKNLKTDPKKKLSPVWEITESTKKPIAYEK